MMCLTPSLLVRLDLRPLEQRIGDALEHAEDRTDAAHRDQPAFIECRQRDARMSGPISRGLGPRPSAQAGEHVGAYLCRDGRFAHSPRHVAYPKNQTPRALILTLRACHYW